MNSAHAGNLDRMLYVECKFTICPEGGHSNMMITHVAHETTYRGWIEIMKTAITYLFYSPKYL